METKSKTSFLKNILMFICLGIWIIILQNAGIIPKIDTKENEIQTVYVKGGYVKSDIDGTIGVKGTVSVSIDEVLGKDGKKYYFDNRGNEFNYLGY
jgi:hypothetical protein